MNSVQVSRQLAASQSVVFDAWTDAQSIKEWMDVTPGPALSVDLDLRVGGQIRIVMGESEDNEAAVITGEFVEIEPPNRLVFTWRSVATNEQDSLVTVELTPDGPDATKLTLTHEQLPTKESAEGHKAGWIAISEKLAAHVGPR